ncbi:S49 family peptidase [Candidatus Parcubacteria bacterium]|nr:S49 family peptidase [Candidatus Parcubacteria bacterium]
MTIKNKKQVFFAILKVVVVIVVVLASVIIIKDEIVWQFSSESSIDDTNNDSCNVAGILLSGSLVTYISSADYDLDGNLLVDQTASEDVVFYINEAEKNDKIKAIILEIDSYGGWPVAAEEVGNALKSAQKPTIALIRGAGVSAGYWVATGTDIIFASKNSDIGGIGVTMSYLDNVKQNQKEGFTYNQLSSGKFKDAGDPDRALSAEETKLFMRDINILHQNFIKTVVKNRGLNLEKVEVLADGSSMLGEMALRNGLIDEIGGEAEVIEYLESQIGEQVEICW